MARLDGVHDICFSLSLSLSLSPSSHLPCGVSVCVCPFFSKIERACFSALSSFFPLSRLLSRFPQQAGTGCIYILLSLLKTRLDGSFFLRDS